MSIWIIVFIVSLWALVKGSAWFLRGAERIGLHFGMSPFVVGALLVALGTSLPELVASIAGVFHGVPEIVVSSAVGSNIANILLIVGAGAVVARSISITKNLIDSELPVLSVAMAITIFVLFDGVVTFYESIILVVSYIIYVVYAVVGAGGGEESPLMTQEEKDIEELLGKQKGLISRLFYLLSEKKDIIFFFIGIIFVISGANYLVQSIVAIATISHIAPAIISATALSFGTSLPELVVFIKSVISKRYDIAIGGVIGSNIFNALAVIGIPGLFTSLPINHNTLTIAIPMMALVTFLIVIAGISRKIYHWEGMFFVLLYILFIMKMFSFS